MHNWTTKSRRKELNFLYTSSVIVCLDFVSPDFRLTVGEDLLPLSVQNSPNLRVFGVQFLTSVDNGLPRSVVRSGQSHVTSQPSLFPIFLNPGGMLSRSLGMPSRNDGPPSIWDTHGKSGNVFCKSNSVFFSTLSERVKTYGSVNATPQRTRFRE